MPSSIQPGRKETAIPFDKAWRAARLILCVQVICTIVAVVLGICESRPDINTPRVVELLFLPLFASIFLFPVATLVGCVKSRTSPLNKLIAMCVSVVLSFVMCYGMLPAVQ